MNNTASTNMSKLSKAQTLEFFRTRLTTASVLPQVVCSFEQWIEKRDIIVHQVLQQLSPPYVVRSSASDEDKHDQSMAGAYLSLLNVDAISDSLIKSVDEVFSSYQRQHSADQVFIQPMLQQPDYAGVMFSQDPSTGAPYYVISVDQSGSTDSVTSGRDSEGSTYVVAHQSVVSQIWLQQLIDLYKQLQPYYPDTALDIEFAIKDNIVYLFQVRPLQTRSLRDLPVTAYQLEQRCIYKKLHRLTQRHPYLLGATGLYGVMPDWNPAEIIGIKPKPLALSLYKELITDHIWAVQRFNYGYRDLRGFPLLLVLGGTPYIDIRVSFNSFVPSTLDTGLAERLVNFYLNKLKQQPHLHDKVEFQVVYSCYSFDLQERLNELLDTGFSPTDLQQISSSLLALTNSIIADQSGVWQSDLKSIESLQQRQERILNSDLNKLDKIYWLLEDCKRYGTLAFAGLARAGFIAVQLLNSMKGCGLLSETEHKQFLLSLNTVSSELVHDHEKLDRSSFLNKYGHLRPGTYDILSARYDEAPELYFSSAQSGEYSQNSSREFSISLSRLNSLNQALQQAGFQVDAIALFNFIKKAIEAREYSKFVFTKSLSDTLVCIEQLGLQLGFTKTELAYTDIKDVLKLHSTTLSAQETLRSSIQLGKDYHALCQWIKLPVLITDPTEAGCFQMLPGEPNFITNLSVIAPCCEADPYADLSGKIVFIEAADPGYDWLFSKHIAALVTQYGGCNSHMAIRAAELGIPAVIGAGERLYNCWKQATVLQLDCHSKKVAVIQ